MGQHKEVIVWLRTETPTGWFDNYFGRRNFGDFPAFLFGWPFRTGMFVPPLGARACVCACVRVSVSVVKYTECQTHALFLLTKK